MSAMSATVRWNPDRQRWTVYVSRDGKRKSITCADEAEARATAARLNGIHEAVNSWLDGFQTTVQPALEGWLETYRPTLSKSYEATASGLIERHLIPAFGAMPLQAITQAHLLAFVDGLYRDGKSGALALNALSLLRRVCQLHVEAGILDRNPCARVGELVQSVARRHEPEVKRAAAWTRDEAAALLDLALRHEKHVHGPLLCALHTGMRRGEILGLEWRDVGPRTIAVERAWVRSQSKAPKSGKPRDVPISGPLRAALDALRPKAARTFGDLGPVFLNAAGNRWDEANFGRSWRRLQKRAVAAGIRPLRFHDSRHTFATWALESGKSIKWVQAMLGHSSPELTLRTYAHLMRAEGDEMDFLDVNGLHTNVNRARTVDL